MSPKLIIDADPGIGDALAIALAAFDPGVDLLAVTAAAGCVSGEQATCNIESLVGVLDPPKWPRLGAASDTAIFVPEDLLGEAPSPQGLSGATGLGDWPIPPVQRHHRHESEKLLADLVRQYPDEVTLLTLGPLTNVMRAIELDPDFPSMLGGLVCLGGSVACGGDVTAAAEYNIFADPEAARFVLSSPLTKTLVPLDTSDAVEFGFDQFDRLELDADSDAAAAPSLRANLLRTLLAFAFRQHRQELGREDILIREVVALLLSTGVVTGERETMFVDVETAGTLTRGATVFDRRRVERWQTNVEVVTAVDPQRVLDAFRRGIARVAGAS